MESTDLVTIERPVQMVTLLWKIKGPNKHQIEVTWKEVRVGLGSVMVFAPTGATLFGSNGLREVLPSNRGMLWQFSPPTMAETIPDPGVTNSQALEIVNLLADKMRQSLASKATTTS